MGFLRKSIIIATGGLAPIKAQSYRERTAKATEQLARQQQAAMAPKYSVHCPYCNRLLTAPAGVIHCTNCKGRVTVKP